MTKAIFLQALETGFVAVAGKEFCDDSVNDTGGFSF
jgi:hypothetical protein